MLVEYNPGTPFFLALGIDAMLSAILADAALAWNSIFDFVDFLLMNG